tara:strand:- start:1774 stop:2310 length:537 start_codon:yes stop_codon:yes gene_type:complete
MGLSNNDKYPRLESEEIDAIREEMGKNSSDIDRYFLLKLHTILILCLFSSALMLFFPAQVTFWVQLNQSVSPDQSDSALTFRGIFVLSYMLAAIYSWRKDRYTELIFGSATIMAATNFLLDLPYLWIELSSPASTSFMFGIFIRVFIIALLISVFRNLDRASYLQGKLFINPFTPLKN